MIYFDKISLPVIVEAVYLEEEFDTSVSSNIHINPENPTYLIGKTVIINTPNYSIEKINILKKNRCKIISRVNIFSDSNNSIEISPYILRPCFNVLWNGQEIEINDWDNFLEEGCGDSWLFKLPQYELYFPKIIGGKCIETEPCTDGGGNLTWLGWLLQQVGVNIREDTVFLDLDLLKTKKMDLGKR